MKRIIKQVFLILILSSGPVFSIQNESPQQDDKSKEKVKKEKKKESKKKKKKTRTYKPPKTDN